MVKVTKVAVWKVDGEFHEDLPSAIKACRTSIIREVLLEKKDESYFDEADMWSSNWEEIQRRLDQVMAGV